MRFHVRAVAVAAILTSTCAGTSVAAAQPQAETALRMGEISHPFEGTIGKGPAAQRGALSMAVVHKLASSGFDVKSGAPKRVSQISGQQVPVTCGEGEDAFESAENFTLPRAYKLRGKNLNVSAKFKAVRSYRDISDRQLRVVVRGKLTKRGKRAKGTVTIVSSSTSGGSTCRAEKAPWSARRANG